MVSITRSIGSLTEHIVDEKVVLLTLGANSNSDIYIGPGICNINKLKVGGNVFQNLLFGTVTDKLLEGSVEFELPYIPCIVATMHGKSGISIIPSISGFTYIKDTTDDFSWIAIV